MGNKIGNAGQTRWEPSDEDPRAANDRILARLLKRGMPFCKMFNAENVSKLLFPQWSLPTLALGLSSFFSLSRQYRVL